MPYNTILVGISSCLLGEKVRYDGGHKLNNYLSDTLGKVFTFRSFCPEVDIGLGTPRETIKLVQLDRLDRLDRFDRLDKEIRCVGTKTSSLDVTDALIKSAHNQAYWHQDLCGYIFKKGSPSCGPSGVKLYGLDANKPEQYQLKGQGINAKKLSENCPQLPIEDEERLGNPEIRDNFIKRIYIYRHWKTLNKEGLDIDQLKSFHLQYDDILISHHEHRADNLTTQLNERQGEAIEPLSRWYFTEMMSILTLIATPENHYKVMSALLSLLSDSMLKIDTDELDEILNSYLEKRLPLLVPITLLAHHFRHFLAKQTNPEIAVRIRHSKYIFPDLTEMM